MFRNLMLFPLKLISAWDKKVCPINLDNWTWENNSCQWIEDCFFVKLLLLAWKTRPRFGCWHLAANPDPIVNKKSECKFGGWRQSWKVYSTKYLLSKYCNVIKPWVLHQLEIGEYMQSPNHISSMRFNISLDQTVQFWGRKNLRLVL